MYLMIYSMHALSKIIEVDTIKEGHGYAYAIRTGSNIDLPARQANEFLTTWEVDIQWTMREFGALSVRDLEVVSTILYTTREMSSAKEGSTKRDVARFVHEIMPPVAEGDVLGQAEKLARLGLIELAPMER